MITDVPKPEYPNPSLSRISVLKMEKCMDVDVDDVNVDANGVDVDADGVDVDADGRVLKTKPVRISSSIPRPI